MSKHNTKEGNEALPPNDGKPSQPKVDDNQLPNTEIPGDVDAGFVHDLDQDSIGFEPQKHRAKTASYLAFILVAILALTLLLHYVSTLILCCYGQIETAKSLGQIFDKWLPVITGFVGGAVTYYFTKEKP
jgi:hypothetical protein